MSLTGSSIEVKEGVMPVSAQVSSGEAMRPATRAPASMLVRSSIAADESSVVRWRHSGRPTVADATSFGVESVDRAGTVVSFYGGSQLYGEEEPVNYLFRLVTGVARGYRMTPDGRRQVVAFYVPGDLFGFEVSGEYTFSVEAVSNIKVRMIKRTVISAIAARDQSVAEELTSGLVRELRRNQQHVLRLGQRAPERVAGFVLEIAARLSNGGTLDLPMSRRDIADYLGVTIETVSRTLTQLTNMAAIAMFGPRKIAIRDVGLLQRFASDAAQLGSCKVENSPRRFRRGH
jgi:CRP/FNR family transcriptional regulator, nitrogen fixation regulation protein